ncbi:MAG: M18 family aminopeptidase [Tissierellia bacterium]|nr:M18 family aminopeptidase [Tissierellia bacterium]
MNSNELIEFIDGSPTPYQGVEQVIIELTKHGFQELHLGNSWNLEYGGKYYIISGNCAIMAFEIGDNPWDEGFHMIGSHLDSPGFRIKPRANHPSQSVLTLNTEVYGGAILHTWFDRPLSIAGQVILDGEPLKSKKIQFKRPLGIIPSLAIHMDREVNKGKNWNPQKECLPVFSLEEKDSLEKLLEKEVEGEILDYDLFLYPMEKSTYLGINQEFISAPRLDNLAMVHSSLKGLVESKKSKKTKVFFAYNHEEIGSQTAQGAMGPLGAEILERIILSLGGGREDFFRACSKSFLISADMAHGIHPNYPEVADPTNRPQLGKGPVIKIAANRSYTSEGHTSAYFKSLCKKAEVECQTFVNASNRRGGSTIGPLALTHLNIPGVDVGNPIWGMHSVREIGAMKDHIDMIKVMKEFYSQS